MIPGCVRQVLTLFLASILLCTALDRAHAADAVLVAGPGDRPLILRTILEAHAPGLATGNIQLTAPGRAVPNLRLLASDLVSKDNPSDRIERSSVSIPAATSLSADQPQDIRVTVANVVLPGTYQGDLRFYLPDQVAPALSVPLVVEVKARPDVKPVLPSVSRQSARCSNWLSCAIAGAILPSGVMTANWLISLDNRTMQAVEVLDASVMLRGDKSGEVLPATAVTLTPHSPAPLPAVGLSNLTLRIEPQQIVADSYRGVLRLKLAGSDEPLLINLELSVRDGPLFAILVILLGICMGRLIRRMDTTEVQRELKLLGRYRVTHARSRSITDADAASHLQHDLELLKQRIEDGRDSEETLTAALSQLELRIDFLCDLERLGRLAAEPRRGDALAAEVAVDVKQARAELLQDKLSEAEALRKQIINKLSMDGAMGDKDAAAEAPMSIPLLVPLPPLPPLPSLLSRFVGRLLSLLSGIRVSNADLRYWLARPVLGVMLLVLLTLLGLQTLYVNAGSSFGASGLADYLGLFLWGLSADVAQRTLQSLPSLGTAGQAAGRV